MKLAISGLTTLPPTPLTILICDDLGPEFLVGRKTLNNWNLSVHYRNKKETWQAGNRSVEAMTQQEAELYNEGLNSDRRPPQEEWDRTRECFNNHRNIETCYGWTPVSGGKKGGKTSPPPLGKPAPPLRTTRVQAVRSEKGAATTIPAPAGPGKPSHAKAGVLLYPPTQVHSLLPRQEFPLTRLCSYRRRQVTPTGTYCSGQPLASLYLPILSAGSR